MAGDALADLAARLQAACLASGATGTPPRRDAASRCDAAAHCNVPPGSETDTTQGQRSRQARRQGLILRGN